MPVNLGKGTATYSLDLRLAIEKIIGLDQFKNQIKNEVVGFTEGLDALDIKPAFKLDATDIQSVIDSLKGYSREVRDALIEMSQAEKDVDLGYSDKRTLQDIRKRVGLFERVLSTRVQGPQGITDDKIASDRFQRVLRDVSTGYYTNASGKRVPIPKGGIAPLTDPKTGPRDADRKLLFNRDDVQNLRLYGEELKSVNRLFAGTQRQLESISGAVPPSLSPALGREQEDLKKRIKVIDQATADIKPEKREVIAPLKESFAQDSEALNARRNAILRHYRQIRTMKGEEAKAERSRLRKEMQQVGLFNKEVFAATKERLRAESRLKSEQSRKDRHRQLVNRQRLSRQYLKEVGGDVTQLGRTRGAQLKTTLPGRIKLMQDALAKLNTRFNQLSDGPKRDQVGRYIRRLEGRIESADKDLLLLTQHMKELNRSAAAGFLPKAGATQAKRKTPNPREASAALGGQVFRNLGGFGSVERAKIGELPELSEYHAKRIRQLKSEQAALNKTSRTFGREMKKSNAQLELHSRELNRAKERMGGFGSATNQAASLFRQFFRYALGYGALYQALQAVRALTASLVDLETQLKGIQAVTAATNAEINTIEGGIKKVALTTQFNTVEIAQAAQILGQAGVIPKELPKAIEATALFASATGSSIEIAADLVTSLRNVFTTLEDNTITNLLTRAINISKLTAQDLKTVVSLSSQIAKTYNLTADQYLAAVTTLRNAGIKPSTVATGLRQGLIELFSPDSKTVKALVTRYQQLGEALSAKAVRDKFFAFSLEDNPLVAVLRELQRLGFTGEGKQVFQRAYDVRAENAISALINDLGGVEAAAADLTFGNAAALAATTQMEALSHSVKNLGAAISVFVDDVAGGALPVIEDWVDGLTETIQKLDELNNRLRVTSGFGLEAGLVGGALGAVAGAKFGPGRILGRVASAGVGAVAGAKLGTSYAESGQAREGNEQGLIDNALDTLKDLAYFVILGALPRVFQILKNLVIGKSIANAFGGEFARKIAENYHGSVTAATGSILKKVAVTATAGGTAPVLLAQLGKNTKTIQRYIGNILGFFQLLARGLGPFSFLLRKIPLVAAFAAMYGLTQAAIKFFNPRKFINAEEQFEQAVVNRERAAADLEKARRSVEEFKLSDEASGYRAKEGTTAATLERLQDEVGQVDSIMGGIFSDYADNIEAYTQYLKDLGTQGVEQGSREQQRIIDDLRRFATVGGRVASEGLADAEKNIRRAANLTVSISNSADTLANSWRQFIYQLNEKAREDLEEIDRQILDITTELIRTDPDFRSIFFGTSDLPARRLEDAFLASMELVLDKATAAVEEAEGIVSQEAALSAARLEAVNKAIRAVRDLDPNSLEFQQVVEKLFAELQGMGQEVIDFVDNQAETVAKARDDLEKSLEGQAKLKEIRGSLERQIADAEGRPTANRRDQRERNEEVQLLKRRLESVNSKIKSDEEINEIQLDLQAQQKLDAELYLKGARERFNVEQVSKERQQQFNNQVEAFRERIEQDSEFEKLVIAAAGAGRPRGERQKALAAVAGYTDQKVGDLTNITEQGVLRFAPDVQVYSDPGSLQKAFTGLAQQTSQERARQQFEFVPAAQTVGERELAESDISLAKTQQAFKELATPGPQNPYQRRYDAQISILEQEEKVLRDKANNDKLITDEQKIRDTTRLRVIRNEKIEALAARDLGIETARVKLSDDSSRSEAKIRRGLIASLNVKLKGLQRELRFSTQGGNIEQAQKADAEILSTKEKILALQLEEFKSTGDRSQGEIDEFVTNARSEITPLLNSPARLQALARGAQRQIDILAPREPDLAETPGESARLRTLGYEPTAGQIGAGFEERLAVLDEYVDMWEQAIALQEQDKNTDPESLNTSREALKKFREEVGRLRAEQENLNLSPQGFTQQLALGFDPGQIANGIRGLDSHFSNLGKTIQEDIVGGLDEAADGFANALVRGEDFADGVRTALSDMAYQVAADIVKSGIMSLIGTLIGASVGGPGGAAAGSQAGGATAGGTGGGQQGGFLSSLFASFGFAKGGVVEAKAAGGVVGDTIKNVTSAVNHFAKYASGGVARALAGGGVIKGPGSGTSDSISGVVVNKQGKAVRGIRVSDGESILTNKTTSGIGKRGVDTLNSLGKRGLQMLNNFLSRAPGYKGGGIPSASFSAADLATVTSAPPLMMATGGLVGNMRDTQASMSYPEKSTSGSGHTYRAEVMVGAQEGADVDPNTLRRMDEGITLRVKEFVQEQMRPGGMLQGSRATAGRG